MAQVFSRWVILLVIEVGVSCTALFAVTWTQTVAPCQYVRGQSYPQIISLDLGINYGNSSTNSWQHLQLPECTTLLAAMQLAGWRLRTQTYGFGVFVQGINGVEQSNAAGIFWQWYEWTGGQWTLGPVGASSDALSQNAMVLWYLAATSAGPPPSP